MCVNPNRTVAFAGNAGHDHSRMTSTTRRSFIKVTAAAGGEIHVTFPAGKIGGPVSISSTQPVLAAQRVQSYQSFNEVSAG